MNLAGIKSLKDFESIFPNEKETLKTLLNDGFFKEQNCIKCGKAMVIRTRKDKIEVGFNILIEINWRQKSLGFSGVAVYQNPRTVPQNQLDTTRGLVAECATQKKC